MKILMFYNYNPNYGSGNIAVQLFNELNKKGNTAKLLVNQYDNNYPEGIISMESYFSYWQKKILFKIKKVLKLNEKIITNPKYVFQGVNDQKEYYKTDRIIKKAKIKPDIIILLFPKNFLNSKNISELYSYSNARIYWLMWDMAALTGGCHYAWDCKGYQNICGNCPGLYSSDPFDITFKNFSYKKKYLDKTNIQIVTGSEWQFRQAKKSTLFKENRIHKILSSFNPEIFKPIDKNQLRKKMDISPKKKIIFFGALGISDEYKGIKYLLDSFKILKQLASINECLNNGIVLLIAGNGFEKIKDLLPFEYHYLGVLDNNYGIASAYQAADIFVCPSIEDSGPSMINQSIMCGTPVVCFEMGVALDLVFTGKTGYRAILRDSNDLAQGMYNILNMPSNEYEEMSENCRNLAMELYEPSVNINKWVQILNKNND